MKTEVQTDTRRCEDCGRLLAVTPTDSPWEFQVAACRCGYAGRLISWAHAAPPPRYESTPRLPLRAEDE